MRLAITAKTNLFNDSFNLTPLAVGDFESRPTLRTAKCFVNVHFSESVLKYYLFIRILCWIVSPYAKNFKQQF